MNKTNCMILGVVIIIILVVVFTYSDKLDTPLQAPPVIQENKDEKVIPCVEKYNQIEPVTQQFVDSLTKLNGPPIYTLPVADARLVLENLQAQPVDKLAVKIEDIVVQGGPSGKLSLRIIRPANYKDGILPVVMYFHGGGWILGSKHTHDRLLREISTYTNCAVVFVNFTPSPEVMYPVAIEEAYAATKFIHQNARLMNLDPARIAVAGDSVGGNMATVVAMLANRRNGPPIVYQVLFYPVVDANFDTPSYVKYENGPWLTKKAMQWFWDAYVPNKADRMNPLICPLKASIAELSFMPPALVITNEHDVLRDEGEEYAKKLSQAGVRVSSVRYNGTIHDCAMLNPLSKTPAVCSMIHNTANMLRYIFSK